MSRLLIASLDRFGPLRDGVRERLATCDQKTESFQSGEVILPAGARSNLRLLVRGLAIKVVVLPEGGRQIFAVAVPGDLIDLAGLFVGCDHDVLALGPCDVRLVSSGEVRALLQEHSSLVAALCRAVLTEARVQRNWMANLGRRSAAARTANLLCEIYWRQKTLGLAKDGRCALPAMQSDIADALGLSTIHIHRVLRTLRDEGLATLRNGALHIQNWEGLAALAAFDPDILRPQCDPESASLAPRAMADQPV